MFPTKSDFMDLQKLLPRPERNVLPQYSPQYSTNKSSSSADSTSPESYYENSFTKPFRLETEHREYQLFENTQIFDSPKYRPNELRNFELPVYRSNFDLPESRPIDTPYSMRQRPILGRKIMPESLNSTPQRPWQLERRYELFPMERRATEFDYSSPESSLSPISKVISPGSIGYLPRVSPITNPISFEKPGPSFGIREQKVCTFCKKNGERPNVYATHSVKEKIGNKYVVTCPVLRSHVCTMCGETGDDAHTITYCPVLRTTNNGKPLLSTTITLKNTRVKSNGKKRYS